jgi:hypothetical protein
MKKIFSLFLFVLISAFVLAQTTYTTAQSGSIGILILHGLEGVPPSLLGDNIVIIDQNHKLLNSFFRSQMAVLLSNPMQNFYILTEIIVFLQLELLI